VSENGKEAKPRNDTECGIRHSNDEGIFDSRCISIAMRSKGRHDAKRDPQGKESYDYFYLLLVGSAYQSYYRLGNLYYALPTLRLFLFTFG
ncbi:MAG: hypothetical protein F6J94_30115, partial [Moorea sp. SIO1F2]